MKIGMRREYIKDMKDRFVIGSFKDCKGKLAGELLKYVEKYRLLNRNEKFYYLEQDFKQFIDIME